MRWFDFVLVWLVGPRLAGWLVLAFYGGGVVIILLVAMVLVWAAVR